jgi:hypothetical protein
MVGSIKPLKPANKVPLSSKRLYSRMAILSIAGVKKYGTPATKNFHSALDFSKHHDVG